ncbi:MAG: hypothetical protein U9R06_01470 [Patescibacteria group bacterium]|nr:hypothetical protein [Patescibacteria group bacterium]
MNIFLDNKKYTLIIPLAIIIIFAPEFSISADAEIAESIETGAKIYLLPDKNSFLDTDNLKLNIFVDPAEKPFNAAEINLTFPPDLLAVASLTYASSACAFLAEEKIDNNQGMLKFVCGTSTRMLDFQTNIAQINFKKIANGFAKLNLSESKIITADGLGTQITALTEIHNMLII